MSDEDLFVVDPCSVCEWLFFGVEISGYPGRAVALHHTAIGIFI
jgi:hypothetical protein